MRKSRKPVETTKTPVLPGQQPVVTSQFFQHVASSVEMAYLTLDRALGRTVDDIERDFGLGVYDEVSADAIVAATLRYLKIMAMGDRLAIVPAFQEEDVKAGKLTVDEQKRCDDYAQFGQRCLDRLEHTDRPFRATLWDMLDCFKYGHKLAEVTYRIETEGVDKGEAVFDSVRPKPRENYAWIVDPYNKVLGIIAIVPGVSIYVRQGVLFNPANYPNAIATNKVFTLRIGGKDDSPKGESLLRPVYDPWWRKREIKINSLKTASLFAGGFITAELDTDLPEVDPVTKLPMAQAVANGIAHGIQNFGVYVSPPGVKITVHQPSADPAFFSEQNDICNREMVAALLINARSIIEAKNGSKADTENAENITDQVKLWVQGMICDAVTSQLMYNLIVLKAGEEEARRFCPRAVMQTTSKPDFSVNLPALAEVGFMLDESQFPDIDQEFGFTERGEGWEDRLAQTKNPAPNGQDPSAKPGQDGKKTGKVKFSRGGKFDGESDGGGQ